MVWANRHRRTHLHWPFGASVQLDETSLACATHAEALCLVHLGQCKLRVGDVHAALCDWPAAMALYEDTAQLANRSASPAMSVASELRSRHAGVDGKRSKICSHVPRRPLGKIITPPIKSPATFPALCKSYSARSASFRFALSSVCTAWIARSSTIACLPGFHLNESVSVVPHDSPSQIDSAVTDANEDRVVEREALSVTAA